MGNKDRVNPLQVKERGQAELVCHLHQENKETRCSTAHEVREISVEDKSPVEEDVNSGIGRSTFPSVGQQHKEPPPPPGSPPEKLQQLPVGTVVRWERFLPLRSLKVLLVENDDSTRQVVSALLRNCSYEVSAVANGVEAWKILGDLTNHVDLILTEVIMPCLSGIGLLIKIMSHKTRKNIPVIMMSSHDSMGIVFKCLSKGAVDFLVKPIRKNELKNLWQHVWRRCHSSSGSGSESGTQTQKSIKSKSLDESVENNIGSNDKDDDTSTGLNTRDGSDNGSGTQSSWTKHAAEVESPQPMSPLEQFKERQDSTCAQVIHPKTETICNAWIPLAGRKDSPDKELHDPKSGKLKIDTQSIPDAQCEPRSSLIDSPNINGPQNEVPVTNNSMKNECRLEEVHRELSNMKEISGQNDAANPSREMANSSRSHASSRTITLPADSRRISEKSKTVVDVEEPPYLELSLKQAASRDCGTITKDERNVLRHSDLSAFSRYNTSAGSNQVPVGCSSFLLDSSSEVKVEPLHNPLSLSRAAPLNQGSNGNIRNNNQSATKIAFAKPKNFTEKVAVVSPIKNDHTSAFHFLHQQSCKAQDTISEKIDDLEASETEIQLSRTRHHVQMQHHHHHHFHHHHHVHTMQPQQHQSQHPQDHDEMALTIAASETPQCGSSNVFGGAMECNAANYSINGSVSGSHHGSNAPNSCAAANTGAINLESDSGGAGKSGDYSGNGSRIGNGTDQNRFTQREAALNKFRQKRKERCFEKKVRYQSRKRLAEQRPRVRGQFVRQAVHELNDPDASC